MDDDTKWGEGRVSVRVRVRVQEGGKNGGRKDCIEGKEGCDGWGKGRNNRMNQTTLLYVFYDYTNGMPLRHVQTEKQHVSFLVVKIEDQNGWSQSIPKVFVSISS